MNKQRKTSNILNVFQYNETTGAVTLPSTLDLTAPGSSDDSTKAPTTAWVRTLISSLGYVTLSTDQTLTGLKTIVRSGDVLNFKIGTDTLYGLKVAYNQNELVGSGEATWSFANTFNNGSGTGITTTPISFFRGVLVTGQRLLSASVNANLLDYYGNNPSGRYPVYAYNTGVQQFASGVIVGDTAGVVNAATGAIADLPAGVVANFKGRVIGSNAVNNNEFVTLSQLTNTSGAYLPLSGGTLTGPLNGTSATFSSSVRINADGQSFLIFPTTTNSVRMQIQSTGGGNLVVGTENSTGGNLATGTNAYASVFTSGSTRDLVLGTNSTARLTINGTSGNVGIGTITPSSRLDVAGAKTNSADLSNAANQLVVTDTTATAAGVGGRISFLGSYTATPDYITLGAIEVLKDNANNYGSASWNNAAMRFIVGNNDNDANAGRMLERMRITSGGNVGIGTVSPDTYSFGGNRRFLTVSNTSTGGEGALQVISSTDGNGNIDFGSPSVLRCRVIGFNNSDLGFFTNGTNSGTGATIRMRIRNTGQIGIGTNTPERQFVISNSGADGIEFTQIGSQTTEIITYNRSTSVYTPLQFESSSYLFKRGAATFNSSVTISGDIQASSSVRIGNSVQYTRVSANSNITTSITFDSTGGFWANNAVEILVSRANNLAPSGISKILVSMNQLNSSLSSVSTTTLASLGTGVSISTSVSGATITITLQTHTDSASRSVAHFNVISYYGITVS